jgi:hypothetical protein
VIELYATWAMHGVIADVDRPAAIDKAGPV